MSDVNMESLLRMYDTPFYLLDSAKLHSRIDFLRTHLPDEVVLCYAVKANSFIVKELAGMVERFEICSPGECTICQSLGIPPEKFVISGVHKDSAQIKQLVADGIKNNAPIGRYTVESTAQLSLLRETAQSLHTTIPVLLRLSSQNQFGLDETTIQEIISKRHSDPWLSICGIQYFSGTQKTSLKRLQREIGRLDTFLESLKEQFGYQAEELEFGPGLPVSYFQGDQFEEEWFLQTFSELLSGMRFQGKKILELGRSIAADCGQYFTKVVDLKRNDQVSYAIVDGGIHQITYFGQSMAMKQPMIHLYSTHPTEEIEPVNICGSLCTANDILVKQMLLPKLHIGDVLMFEKAGAYCMTEGISLFLSRDLPKVILAKEDGTHFILRDPIETQQFNTPIYKKGE